MNQPVILSAVRTPIGKFQGGLSSLSATDLGARVFAEAVRCAGIEPNTVDEIIMGNVVSADLVQNHAPLAFYLTWRYDYAKHDGRCVRND